jgi:hypothetical protein
VDNWEWSEFRPGTLIVYEEQSKSLEMRIMDKANAYDVFKGSPEKKPLWLGTVTGLQRAIDQMNRIAARMPCDYFVCSAATHEVVASLQAEGSQPIRAAQCSTTEKRAS